MTTFCIEYSQQGQFKQNPERVYYLTKNDSLTLLFDSKKLKSLKPLLLTNLPRKNSKNKFSQPNASAITKPGTLKKEDLNKNYTYYPGFFNKEFTWQCDIKLKDVCGSIQMQIVLVNYHSNTELTENIQQDIEIEQFGRVEYIVINPDLKIGKNSVQLSDLTVQTVLPYQLGKSDRWLQILNESTSIGYNAIHFPPIQELGESGSLYSIRDQLKVNPDLFEKQNFDKLQNILHDLEHKQGAISFIDILLNHTSADSDWLIECEGSCYNEKTVPQLKSAIDLDIALQEVSDKISKGKLEGYEGRTTIEAEVDIQTVMQIINKNILVGMKFEEYFLVNIEDLVKEFNQRLKKEGIELPPTEFDLEDADNFFAKSGVEILEELVQQNTKNLGAGRFAVTIDLELVVNEVKKNPSTFSQEGIRKALNLINEYWIQRVGEFMKDAYNGIEGTIRWEHISKNKPQINEKQPLLPRYFSQLKNGQYAANNGWIMNLKNVQENFAESDKFHYLRRSIVIWSDLIKLRYGNCKNDSKPLWTRMKKYVQKMAQLFQGFRLDNAHSTPLNVGEYLLKKARQVNPNLVVFAELFTGDPVEDAQFVKRLGINNLVRETIHATSSQHLFGQLEWIAKCSSNYVGCVPPSYEFDLKKQEKLEVLVEKLPPVLIYDQTHDNESVLQLKGPQQIASQIGLLTFSRAFKGTVKGIDELYDEHLSVVTERRQYKEQDEIVKIKEDKDGYEVGLIYTPRESEKYNYQDIRLFGSFNEWKEPVKCEKEGDVYIARFKVQSVGTYFYKFTVNGNWTLDENKQEQEGNHYFTITVPPHRIRFENLKPVRQAINEIDLEMRKDYPSIQVKYHQFETISIQREHNSKHESYMLISRTAYPNEAKSDYVNFKLECPGQLDNVSSIFVTKSNSIGEMSKNVQDGYISGLQGEIYEEFNLREFADFYYCPKVKKQVLHFYNLKPGTVIILKCSLAYEEKQNIIQLNNAILNTSNKASFDIFSLLKPVDINYLLYISSSEEWEKNSQALFQLPNKGYLNYAGFGGVFNDINVASKYQYNDIPLVQNIKSGNWLVDYLESRVYRGGERLQIVAKYISDTFQHMKQIPHQHRAYYFFVIVKIFYQQIVTKIYAEVKPNKELFLSTFNKNLLLAAYQFIGESSSNQFQNFKVSLSAGLPHFATGWSRAWGRDTFIAIRGILLITGMFAEAKSIILMFASTLRHGLIPNLLDGGRNSRFNCRDSCWFFIKAIKDYIEFTKDTDIWKEEVLMQFQDDSMELHKKYTDEGKQLKLKLSDIVQQIIQKHASGISYREWNAGDEIDTSMNTKGFNISLQLDLNTGFIVGGNQHNCLTWMDKMGSSEKAGNKGIPATSRNGSPIELTALCKLSLDFLDQQNTAGHYPHKSVQLKETELTFKAWSQLIQQNFEKYYWVPENPDTHDDKKYAYITGMYKDVVQSKDIKKEYHLRPNSCIAIAVAPELFTHKNAIQHIKKCEKYLVEENSIGIKTLDPLCDEYIPYYDNEDDTTRMATAHGFSYHQGPEWVWVYGFFVKAIHQLKKNDPDFRQQTIMSYLANHKHHLANNDWLSLPEITNNNGNHNKFSCPAQAWSIACILEVCHDLQ